MARTWRPSLLGHADGATSVVDCSYATRLASEPFPQTLVEIDGETGTLRLRLDYRLEINGPDGFAVEDVAPALLPWAQRPWHNIQESVQAIQAHWVACLRDGSEPQTSGADNLRTLALVEAAYASAASGTVIDLAMDGHA